MDSYEKLGAFYLGKRFDTEADQIRDELLLYDSKDLTTHAVCVGMTGSGKTGLCVGLLEEAAIDGIPALIIDPKGDLGNLLLTFPDLSAADFEPWIDEGTAKRKGLGVAEFAKQTATQWSQGLADWGQDGTRIQRLKDAAEVAIYTPGASNGRPLRVLQSFAAPSKLDDEDALRERVQATVSGLLSLIGVDSDPMRSREHVLLSNLIDHAWRRGQDLDLTSLIVQTQTPPFDRLGVMDLETFFPAKDRAELAMRLNGMLASPGFGAWLEGEPLDIQNLLYTKSGKPRLAIISIAHLSDAERMFLVTILLNEVVTWMRNQSGTSSLRALLYMDEVFGYLPPTANPPSKLPLLTLLKQARASGLGIVLATQNPVDLDYKALSNAGTWFIGRLQTERDKMRVLDGLEGASAESGGAFDRGAMERTLAGLDSRVFLLNNVHEDRPEIFHTRWVMSYLRGPLTRNQIRSLCVTPATEASLPETQPSTQPSAAAGSVSSTAAAAPGTSIGGRPILPGDVKEFFAARREASAAALQVTYLPSLLTQAQLHYTDRGSKLDHWKRVNQLVILQDPLAVNLWDEPLTLEQAPTLIGQPESGIAFAPLPGEATRSKSYTSWKRKLKTALYRTAVIQQFRAPAFKLYSGLGESESEFGARVRLAAREKRDLAVEKLRKRYAPKLQRLTDRIATAEDRVEREEEQVKELRNRTVIDVGATVLGAIFGRKLGTVGRASRTMRTASRRSREKQDIKRAQDKLETLQEQLDELEAEFETQLEALESLEIDPVIEPKPVRPTKGDIDIESLQLVWTPWAAKPDGRLERLF